MRLLGSTLTQISSRVTSQTASQHIGSTHGLRRTSSTHASKRNRDQPTGEVARETWTSNFVLHTMLTLTSLTKSSLLQGRQLFEATNRNSGGRALTTSAVSAALVTARGKLFLRINQTRGHRRSGVLQFLDLLHLLGAARGQLSHKRFVLLRGVVLLHLGLLRLLGQIRDQRPSK